MNTEATPISSAGTFPMKFLFPLAWWGIWSWGTAELFRNPPGIHWQGGGLPPVWAKWAFLAGLVIGAIVIGKISLPLKRIALAGDHLVVSNYFREVQVPLREVGEVGLVQGWNINNSPVAYVTFTGSTEFGRDITFYPRSEDVLKRLQSACQAATVVPIRGA